jgi:predicted nucleic acid-binding protein
MMMMDDKALFVDTNILINANIIETPFHEQACSASTQHIKQIGRYGSASKSFVNILLS